MGKYEIPDGYKTHSHIYYTQSKESSKTQNTGVYAYCKRLIKEHFFSSVLDVGCGQGRKLMTYIRPLVNRMVGMDIKEAVVLLRQEFPKEQWEVVNFEKSTNPLKENFDLLICVDVIEHMEDPDKLLDFIRKQATNSTAIVISTPERGNYNPNGPPPNAKHVREWTREELKRYLKKSGFKVQSMEYIPNGGRQTIVALCSLPIMEV